MDLQEPIRVFLADIGCDYLQKRESQLQSAGLRTFHAKDYQSILAEVHLCKFDVVVVAESFFDMDSLDLPQILKCINDSVHLPVIWMPENVTPQITIAGLELNVDVVLEQKGPPALLISHILSVVKRKRQIDEFQQTVWRLREMLAHQNQHLDKLKNNNFQLREMSMTDPLTQLFNKRYMQRWLTQAFAQTIRSNNPMSIVFIDLDHFKWINDCYGHQTGDIAIQMVGAILKNSVRDSDLVARYAGDEFLLALPNTPSDQIGTLTERIFDVLKKTPVSSGGETFYISCSMGSATYPEEVPVSTSEELLSLADQALYAAKRSGRGKLAQWHQLPIHHREAAVGLPHLQKDDGSLSD